MYRKIALGCFFSLLAQLSATAQTPAASLVKCDRPDQLYIGVDNPVSFYLPVSDWATATVSISEGEIRHENDNHFVARVNQPGQVFVSVQQAGRLLGQFSFVVKRVPDPSPSLNGAFQRKNTKLKAADFRETRGLGMWSEISDVDGHCRTVQYTLTRIDSAGARTSVHNLGARYEEPTRKLVALASAGDIYLFSDLEAGCAGDTDNRSLSNYAILIE